MMGLKQALRDALTGWLASAPLFLMAAVIIVGMVWVLGGCDGPPSLPTGDSIARTRSHIYRVDMGNGTTCYFHRGTGHLSCLREP